MKKIKIILLILLVMFLAPNVYAAEGVAIESVTLDSKSDNAVIVSDATFDELALKVDLKFNDVNDFVKYKLVIKNLTNTDYELSESTSSSSYITYEYSYDDDSKVLGGNTSKTMFITIKYSNAVPIEKFSGGNYTETKSFTINLEDGTSEITVPSTIDGLYCYLVILVGTLVFSLALLKATRNKKFLVLIIASMILIPLNIHAISKLKITVESKVEINNPNEITPMIYWAIQENGTGEAYEYNTWPLVTINTSLYKLVISNKEVDGVHSGRFAGTKEFTYDDVTVTCDAPWVTDDHLIDYVSEVKIDGRVVPTSTAYWFMNIGSGVKESVTFDLNTLNTVNVTDMSGMFGYAGANATTFSLDLSSFDTSNVTDMSYMFSGVAVDANNFNLNLSNWSGLDETKINNILAELHSNASIINLDFSGWDTSNVTNMKEMFAGIGNNATILNLDLSGWDTSNVTDMSWMFEGLGYNATTLNLDLSGWNTSKVESMDGMFCGIGLNATDRNIVLPETNGDGIINTASGMFGKTEEDYADYLNPVCK